MALYHAKSTVLKCSIKLSIPYNAVIGYTETGTQQLYFLRRRSKMLLVFRWRVDAEVKKAELYKLMRLGDEAVQEAIDLPRYEVRKVRSHENSAFGPISAVEDHTRARYTQTHTSRNY